MRLKKLVGLTGKTGAGKSTVSAYFKEKGAYIIDGDVVARNVFNVDKTLIDKLVDAFGNILNNDKTLNRSELAKRAFSSPEKTEILNSIMHPAINKLIENEAEKAFENHDVVIVDAAAIIESGFTSRCDSVIVVTAPVEIRKKRIMIRDSLTEENALIRINGQRDDEFYLSKADFIVNNDGDSEGLKAQLIKLEKEIFTVE
jgi:dephospho-CoA kinase